MSSAAASGGRASRLVEALWILFLLALPFYLLPSGSPQLADLPLLAIILMLGWRLARGEAIGFPAAFTRCTRSLFLFVLYACTVGLVWTFLLGDPRLLVYPLFYVYNGVVFAALLLTAARCGDRFLRLAMHASAATLFLQLLISPFLLVQDGFRYSLFFNNPNQLGYFALLGATIFLLGDRHFKVPWYYLAGVMTASIYLVLLSLSKSAFLAMLLLLITALPSRRRVFGVLWLLLLLVILTPDLHPILENAKARFLEIGSGLDDRLTARGYARIFQHPGYLVLGAGEGAIWRLETLFSGEIHSSFGTLFFSYGLLGFGLFTAMLLSLLRGAGWGRILLLAPVFFYGLTHQGLRFRLFWVLLSYFLASGVLHEKEGRE